MSKFVSKSDMLVKTFEELIVWQKSHQLVLIVYKISENYPKHELFGLVSQTRRAAVSVPSNIAEGFKRRTKNDSVHFYNMADTSLEEVKYDLILARDLNYIAKEEYQKTRELADEVGKLLSGWIKSQK